jgi:hypothetical protein
MARQLQRAAKARATGGFQAVTGNGRENRLHVIGENARMMLDERVRFRGCD